MFRAVAAIAALLLAAAILLSGNGLQATLLSVRADIEGFPIALIGVLMASYYVGFILGCRFNPGFIKSVGHIRTFVALASVASAATLMHALVVNVVAWAILRAASGFCFAGLVMIIESWINERAANSNRGRILSIYRIVDLTATTAGNALLATANPAGFELFAMTSILLSVALVPVALTRSAAPAPIERARLDIPRLLRVSPVAAIGAPMIGLGNAAFWAVGPVYVQQLGYDKSVIAAFMSAVIIGAAALQWPLGWLSDHIDRRLVMVGAALLGVSAALTLAQFGGRSEVWLLSLGALFGAFALPMFGLIAAHANDLAESGAAVETNGGILLLNAAGSAIGAVAGGVVMSIYGPGAIFDYIAAVYFCFTAFCLVRILSRTPTPEEDKTPFTPVPRVAAPTVFEIAYKSGEEESADAPASAPSS